MGPLYLIHSNFSTYNMINTHIPNFFTVWLYHVATVDDVTFISNLFLIASIISRFFICWSFNSIASCLTSSLCDTLIFLPGSAGFFFFPCPFFLLFLGPFPSLANVTIAQPLWTQQTLWEQWQRPVVWTWSVVLFGIGVWFFVMTKQSVRFNLLDCLIKHSEV